MLYPFRVIEADYEGYNILQIDTDKFLALAKSRGRVTLRRSWQPVATRAPTWEPRTMRSRPGFPARYFPSG